MNLLTVSAALLAALLQAVAGSSTSSPPIPGSSPFVFDIANQRPVSFRSGPFKAVLSKWENARDLALLEQAVEDHNAEIVATAPDAVSKVTSRRLIVLPSTSDSTRRLECFRMAMSKRVIR